MFRDSGDDAGTARATARRRWVVGWTAGWAGAASRRRRRQEKRNGKHEQGCAKGECGKAQGSKEKQEEEEERRIGEANGRRRTTLRWQTDLHCGGVGEGRRGVRGE
ncbi:hypothetical protein J1614_008856 [Plenodomus biglobosus]|nr:hypothetical protein J1614_008856 [Plenodomus biglobosus]